MLAEYPRPLVYTVFIVVATLSPTIRALPNSEVAALSVSPPIMLIKLPIMIIAIKVANNKSTVATPWLSFNNYITIMLVIGTG